MQGINFFFPLCFQVSWNYLLLYVPGSYALTLWRKSGIMNLEHLFSIQFEGIYSKPKGYKGQLAYPKVLISPQAKFIATLDVIGCFHIFKLDKEGFSLSNVSSRGQEIISDNVDFTWWSDHVLAIAKRTGVLVMFDILNGLKLKESDPVYTAPVLERVQLFEGNLFLLESVSSGERKNQSDLKETDDSHCIEHIIEDRLDQIDISCLNWSLISFSEKSIQEMYSILVSNKDYQTALDFANCHGLDKDEVMKSQWLHSTQGINEVKMFLSKIKDQGFVLAECVDKVGPTEDAVKTLLEYGLRLTNQYRFSEEDFECNEIWDFRMARLKLLQFRDRLETYIGINMGRYG